MAIIFVFLDGVGLAPAGPDNPLTLATPALAALLGGPLTIERAAQRAGLLLRPIDATLGVDGMPQSGTGQTALLAGVNAAALHGRHQPHFPPVALRPLLAERSIFRRVAAHGGRATFANAFGDGYWEALRTRRIRKSASVIATEGAGLRFRDLDDLRAGRALSWDITGATLRGRPEDLPPVTSEQAGANLAHLAHDDDLVFFECFLPDLAGHGRLEGKLGSQGTKEQASEGDTRGAVIGQVLARIDGLLGGLLAAKRPGDTLLLTSDHGNCESLAAIGHTRNPVPLLAVGPAATDFADITDIAGVAAVIEQVLAQESW